MKLNPALVLVWAAIRSLELLNPTAAFAHWEINGNLVHPQAEGQSFRSRVLTDDALGVLVLWEQSRLDEPNNIFCTRLTGLGDRYPGWPVEGVPLGSPPMFNSGPDAVSDGRGGLLASWIGSLAVNPFPGFNGFAQHVESSGNLADHWPDAGVKVCSGTSGFPVVAQDGAGGAFLAWDDNRKGDHDHDIFAQHVAADGSVWLGWPSDGLGISTSVRDDFGPQILSDGSGGAFITWSSFVGSDLYLQRITPTGELSPGWPQGGVLVSGVVGNQLEAVMAPDGAGGVFLAWYDARNDDGDIYAQRITATGSVSPGWPQGGVPVCTAPFDQVGPVVIPIEAGKFMLAWADRRSTTFQVYTQCLNSDGTVAEGWPINGLPLGHSGSSYNLAPDGTGGAIVAWSDGRGDQGDIYAARLLPDGRPAPGWNADGVPLCTASGTQDGPSIAPDGQGGAIVSWTDSRRTFAGDIYAARVTSRGITGPEILPELPRLQTLSVRPNPVGDHADISFQLPSPAAIDGQVFDLRGRVVTTLASSRLFQAGPGSFRWTGHDDAGNVVRPGVYFVRVKSPINSMIARVVKL